MVKKHWIPVLGALSLSSLLTCCAPPGTSPTAGSPQSCAWSATPVTYPASTIPATSAGSYDTLSGIAAITPNDLWAVGSYATHLTTSGWPYNAVFVEHSDGKQWTPYSAPDALDAGKFSGDSLSAVAGSSATDIWAVGMIGNTGDSLTPPSQTLTEHFNGSSWSIVNAPDAYLGSSQGSDDLSGVAVLSPSNAWAVGTAAWNSSLAIDSSFTMGLVEHWDGTRWNVVTLPSPVPSLTAAAWSILNSPTAALPTQAIGSWSLSGIDALSASNIWVVGSETPNVTTTLSEPRTLVEHWNGSTWNIVPTPDLTLNEPMFDNSRRATDSLTAITGTSSDNLWAVGGALPQGTLTLHWDGSSWKIIPSPTTGNVRSYGNATPLTSAAATGSAVWSVGAVLMEWNGAEWKPMYTVNGQQYGNLTGVAAPNSADLWAVGNEAILHRHCG